MDPLIAGLIAVLTIGGGFIFARQEGRIKHLESTLEKMVERETSCREKVAKLEVTVEDLEDQLTRSGVYRREGT